MHFFNFHNEQTYHFFSWIVNGGAVDAKAMVAKALARSGGDDGLKMGRESTEAAHAKLRGWLVDLVENISGFTLNKPSGIGMPMNGGPNAFLRPLLHDAVRQIRVDAVAEALLKMHGHWVDAIYPADTQK